MTGLWVNSTWVFNSIAQDQLLVFCEIQLGQVLSLAWYHNRAKGLIEIKCWYIYISRITLNSQETKTLNLSSGVVFFFCLSSVSPGNWTETDNLSRIYPLISKISFFKRSSEHQESSDLVFISNFLYKVVFHSCLAHTSR